MFVVVKLATARTSNRRRFGILTPDGSLWSDAFATKREAQEVADVLNA
jgi:hypothetical protein